MMLENSIDLIRIIIALAMLGFATYLDLRSREINDLVWILFGCISVALIFFSPNIMSTLVSIGISLIIAPVAIVIWRTGLFGGADAFCLIVLAALSMEISFSQGLITPFTTLTNSAILSIAPIFLNLSKNAISIARHENIFEGLESEPRYNKILALFIGHRAKNPKFSFSIERQEGGNKRFDFALKNADDAEFCTLHNTWVTPGIPYIIYITAGFLVQLAYGDIIFNFVKITH